MPTYGNPIGATNVLPAIFHLRGLLLFSGRIDMDDISQFAAGWLRVIVRNSPTIREGQKAPDPFRFPLHES